MTPGSRPWIVAGGLAAFTVVAAAAWSLWPNEPRGAAEALAPASTDAAPQGRVAPAIKLPAGALELQVNSAATARVTAGSSVIFTVSLTGSPASPPLRLGGAGRPWSGSLRFEIGDPAQPLPWRLATLGDPVTVRLDAGTPASSPAGAAATGEVVVDESSIHQIELGVSPDEAARIAAGTYSIRVALSLPDNTGGELVSNRVELVVEPPGSTAASVAGVEKLRLEAAARFHLSAGQWEDARGVALQLVQRDAPDTLAYRLLGDALAGLGRDDEAIAAYREALGRFPETSPEAPEYLIARIAQVEERVQAAKRGGK